MITRIKVRNFLSLRDTDMKLGPCNVLVGPNMSGKSNLFECFKFLQEATSQPIRGDLVPLQEALSRRGGFGEVAWRGEPEGPIGFVIIADLPNSTANELTTFHYELLLRVHEYGHPVVEMEKLSVEYGGKQQTILENAEGKLRLFDDGQTSDRGQSIPGSGLHMIGRHGTSPGGRFRKFIENWRFYHLVPALMRQGNLPRRAAHLSEHGENLSAWLFTLQNHAEEFSRIKQVCRDVLPGIAELLFQPVEPAQGASSTGTQPFNLLPETATISIGTNETRFKRPISLARMSDGELAFLALISIILAPEELSPSLMCIEEPENHLHPKLLEILVELLKQRAVEADAPQMLLTTHSPLLVDRVSIGELLVASKLDGATRFTRPSTKKHFRRMVSEKEASLGDLWYSGALSDS